MHVYVHQCVPVYLLQCVRVHVRYTVHVLVHARRLVHVYVHVHVVTPDTRSNTSYLFMFMFMFLIGRMIDMQILRCLCNKEAVKILVQRCTVYFGKNMGKVICDQHIDVCLCTISPCLLNCPFKCACHATWLCMFIPAAVSPPRV